MNGASLDGKRRILGSVALDGADDYAETADPVVDTSKSFTISAWARPTNAARTGVVAAVAGTNSSAFGLYYDASVKRWLFARTSADVNNPTRYQAASKEAPVNGAWTHLIGTYDASTGALELFVNGRLQQTSTSPTTPAWHAAGPLTVGRAKYAGAFTGNFAGSLDQVNLWQRVLVADEIPALVDPRLGGSGNDRIVAGVAAYWPLDTWRLEYKPVDQFSGQWIFARGDAASSTETLAISPVDRETLSGWHLLAGAYVPSSGEFDATKLYLTDDYRPFDGSIVPYAAAPPRAGDTVLGAARTTGKAFNGRLDDLRLYAGNAQGPKLCEDYPDLDNCGS